MLTALLLIQCAINAALVGALFLLLRERSTTARAMRVREERLASLAAEFCALGRAVAEGPEPMGGHSECSEEPQAASTRQEQRPGPAGESGATEAAQAETPERLHAVAAFLDQGLSVEAVVGRTAVPQGEVQVLQNLRRTQRLADAPRRGRASGTSARARQAAVHC